MIRKYFSEIFVEICMGIAVIILALTLCSMGMMCMLSYLGII